jgi:hypothetical protein
MSNGSSIVAVDLPTIPLMSGMYPLLQHVFTELLPSNGYSRQSSRHNIIKVNSVNMWTTCHQIQTGPKRELVRILLLSSFHSMSCDLGNGFKSLQTPIQLFSGSEQCKI